jgi:hypothetical protein
VKRLIAAPVTALMGAGIAALGWWIYSANEMCSGQFPPPQCHGPHPGAVLAAGFGSVLMVAGAVVVLGALAFALGSMRKKEKK